MNMLKCPKSFLSREQADVAAEVGVISLRTKAQHGTTSCPSESPENDIADERVKWGDELIMKAHGVVSLRGRGVGDGVACGAVPGARFLVVFRRVCASHHVTHVPK
jgi:hypothetical protein